MAPKKPQEYSEEAARVVELRMPIEAFWDMRDVIQKADYLIATGHETSSVGDLYKKLFKLAAPHAVSEVDRAWLYSGGT